MRRGARSGSKFARSYSRPQLHAPADAFSGKKSEKTPERAPLTKSSASKDVRNGASVAKSRYTWLIRRQAPVRAQPLVPARYPHASLPSQSMKITCQSCQSKYTVSDEKVQGKTVKIKCRKCGATILVNSGGVTTEARPSDAVSTVAGTRSRRRVSYLVNVGRGRSAVDVAWPK